MRKYLEKIQLTQNDRGVWGIDPLKGCKSGMMNNDNGCYDICYACKIAKFRGYNFSKIVKRYFFNGRHIQKTVSILKSIPFVRIGVNCDPSDDWKHTFSIINIITPYQKNIVIVTKHWNELPEKYLSKLSGLVVNTSISALDKVHQIRHRLFWYNKLKNYCKSILRVNTAKFNLDNHKGFIYNKIQNNLLNNEKVIDNILRFPKSHRLVKQGIIVVKKEKFLNTYVMASKNNDNTHLGYCKDCKDQCGILL